MPKIDLDALEAMRSALDALTVGSGEWIEAWERYADTSAYAAPALIAAARERDALKTERDDALRAVKIVQNAARSLDAGWQKVVRNLQKPIKDERNAVATLDSERDANAILTNENDALRAALKQAVGALVFGAEFGERVVEHRAPDCECGTCVSDREDLRIINATLATLKSAIGDQHE